MGRPMRLELTRVGLLDYLANRYTTKGVLILICKLYLHGSRLFMEKKNWLAVLKLFLSRFRS